ncbi:MAG: DUF5615 family PIN-like protein [Bacteroidetes bacterium]|nr:DUF5615 family PIN-like protein [Bacteroidota bacterium]
MKFLANENFPTTSIRKMREENFIVESVSEVMASVSDKIVLAHAAVNKQIILTFDKDYGHLIFKEKIPAPQGVLFFRFNPANPEEPFDIFKHFFVTHKTEITGWFIVVERDVIRKRKL